jgi:hypothetical protein
MPKEVATGKIFDLKRLQRKRTIFKFKPSSNPDVFLVEENSKQTNETIRSLNSSEYIRIVKKKT